MIKARFYTEANRTSAKRISEVLSGYLQAIKAQNTSGAPGYKPNTTTR